MLAYAVLSLFALVELSCTSGACVLGVSMISADRATLVKWQKNKLVGWISYVPPAPVSPCCIFTFLLLTAHRRLENEWQVKINSN